MFLGLRSEDLFLPSEVAEEVYASLPPGELSDSVRYLTASHLGALLIGYDAGRLPAADKIRASRDIKDLQGILGDLESLNLIVAATWDSRWRELAPGVVQSLGAALVNVWERRAEAARRSLIDPKGPSSPLPGQPRSRVWFWLRNMLVFIAHRGLRKTNAGRLHHGDIRRYQAQCDLPSWEFLEHCAQIGEGLGLFLPLEARLLVGDGIDLLDMPSSVLARTSLERWVEGSILGESLASITAQSGMLSAWMPAIKRNLSTAVDRYWHAADQHQLALASMSPLPPDPVSPLLEDMQHFHLQNLHVDFLQTHRRLRAGWMNLVLSLPRGVAVSRSALLDLAQAQVALDHLKRPTLVPLRKNGSPARLFASASWLLPAMQERLQEHLFGWMEEVLEPHGLTAFTDHHLFVHPEAPRSPLPEGVRELHGLPDDGTWISGAQEERPEPSQTAPRYGRVIVQPNGDVIAPPDAPIHTLIHLACGARPTKFDQVMHFSMDRRSLMRLIDSSIEPVTWGETLSAMLGAPLPGTVESLVDEVARRHGELSIIPAGGILIAKDPVRLQELLSYARISKQVIHQPAPNVAVLQSECDLSQLLDDIGDRGFSGIILDRPDSAS